MRFRPLLLASALAAASLAVALPGLAGAATPATAPATTTTDLGFSEYVTTGPNGTTTILYNKKGEVAPPPKDPAALAAYTASVALAKGETVYVTPGLERIFGRIPADEVRGKITRVGGSPIYVAVLPGNALTDDGVKQLKELTLRLGYSTKATVIAITGGRMRAASTAIPYATAGRFADEAVAANDGQPLEVQISDFIDRLAKEEGRSDSGGTGGVITGVVLTIIVFGGGGILLLRRRRRWHELVLVQPLVEEDVEAIGKELRTVIEPEASTVRVHLDQAGARFRRARGVEHLPGVAAEIVQARRALAVARAELAGEQPPVDRVPCLFDSRHGASTVDVEWTPASGGAPRVVACCAVDAQRIANGLQPVIREVPTGEDAIVPWTEASPAYRYYLAPGRTAELAGLPAGAPLRARRWVP